MALAARGGRLTPDINDFFNGRADCSGSIREIDGVGAVDGALRLEKGTNAGKLLIGDQETRMEGFAAGLLELDGRGLVPYNVVFPQAADEHDHVDGVRGGVDAPAENCSHVIAGASREWQIQAYLTPVRGDVSRSAAGAAVACEIVEGPATQLVGNEGGQGHLVR